MSKNKTNLKKIFYKRVKKNLYLSGAISKNPNYLQDFSNARIQLIKAGYKVKDPTVFCKRLRDWKACMRKCLQVLSHQTAIAVIDTPHESEGRTFELHVGLVLGMEIKTVDEWIQEIKNEQRL